VDDLKQQNLDFGSVAATILDGDTETALIETKNNVITGLITDSDFGGANIFIDVAVDKASPDWKRLKNADGTDLTFTVSSDEAVIVIPQLVAGWKFLRLVSDTAQAGSDTELTVVGRPI